MSEFVQGQRWVVDSEPELGLGIVVSVEVRSVSIFFPLANCERMYASGQAPLTRIIFAVDDTINVQDGESYTVVDVKDHQGLLLYDVGSEGFIPETQLSAEIQLNQPFMRLMTGQIDKSKWFYFRRELDAAMAKVWGSRLNGLLGVRASLIPHQLYVAYTACDRDRVRVLLADEVGLGKTLEAGMILGRLLKLERAKRALIVVPDALQVQWLVELIRRFGLSPGVYDEAGYDFEQGQIHILKHSALVEETASLLTSEFDVVIVDEAHHIQPDTDGFDVLRSLSELCAHMVLVTATPEQLGFESHFARLQLLDPDKYTNTETLMHEETGYAELNALIRDLPASRNLLIERFDLDPKLEGDELISQVLDCHGVGRVMFRNVRASVKGFPAREPRAHDLTTGDWHERYEWLAQFLKAHPHEKVLVICHEKERVVDCENYIWQKHGIDPALFHEDMDLIERDRAAAYFADFEKGAQVLLCSEIGSEGRNFQFSHHLLCLDLPDHPDMLEQRIGRLDRIGQTKNVNVHALIGPKATDENAQRWHWYHNVLDCVGRQNAAAGTVHDQLFPGSFAEVSPELEVQAKQAVAELEAKIRQGRDALLEMNSCRQPLAGELVERIDDFEWNTPIELVDMASQLLNFHFEDLGKGIYSLMPADNMLIAALPGIPPEGIEISFERDVACAREDVVFMTWDSTFITGLWELLHHSEIGSAGVALLPSKQLPAGQCLLEACFGVVVQSQFASECLPFLESYSVRTLALDISDKDLSAVLGESQLQQSITHVDKKLARKIIQSKKLEMPAWYAKAEAFSLVHKEALLNKACEKVVAFFGQEKNRLTQLSKKNPAINAADIEALALKEQNLLHALKAQTHLQLSAVRLIVTTEAKSV
ncbi:helicase-related protein [Marinagarivorans algicola]|uniref:helicase-related protein n=1 Tax=Marinagarivorans algicola TaxID=1513270 RepID=UPI0006B4CDCB|nr:helicase-related protein [Marinagarivorans algicola]